MKMRMIVLLLLLASAGVNAQGFDQKLFEQFVTMRAGAGEPVYWYCFGELYAYPAGKLLAKVEGIDTARLLKAESKAGVATQISRKIFIYRDPATGEVMRTFNGQPVAHIEYPYQHIRYELRGREVVSFVEQGSGARRQTIGPVPGMTARRLDNATVFSAPLFLNYETPRGKHEGYENYDFLVQPGPQYQLSWNRFGDLPPFMGAGKSVMQLVSRRLDKYAELPATMREYLEKEAPLWKQPPRDMDEIRQLQQGKEQGKEQSVKRQDADLDQLAEFLTGSFDTFEQVAQDEANNTAYKHVRAVLNITPVTIAGMSETGRTLYIEQALAETPDKPYRQGVYLLARDERGALVNRNFRVSNPEQFTGAWRDAAKLQGLTKERLTPIAGCDIVLTKADERRYTAVVGLHGSCKSTLRGATHMVSHGEITPAYQLTLDQGFDDAGNHKWGPPPGVIGHLFKKRAAAALSSDLQALMEMFAGEFDNFQQVWAEQETKAQHPHERIHSIFHRVKLPAIGEHVFYVKQYLDGDPAKMYRQRLYSFAPNEQEKAIELRIYTFPDEKAVTDAHLDESKLAGLTLERLRATPGCEVYWQRQGEQFNGYMKPTCRVNSQRLGKTLVITDNLKLTRDEIWINDQAKDTEGNYVFGNRSGEPHKLKRARYFDGWFAVRKDGARTSEDVKPEDYLSTRNLRLHNQGGRAVLVGPNGEQTKFTVELAQLIQQAGKVEVLVLKLYEAGNERAIAYTWTQPDAWRIGLNLRWLQAGFTLKQ